MRKPPIVPIGLFSGNFNSILKVERVSVKTRALVNVEVTVGSEGWGRVAGERGKAEADPGAEVEVDGERAFRLGFASS